MKLMHLYIKDHLLLQELRLRFDRDGRLDEKESYRLDFLVGVNGSGKSTLLRTLVEIFSSLQTGEGADFQYSLEYELDNQGLPFRITVEKFIEPSLAFYRVITTVHKPDHTIDTIENPVLDSQYWPENIVVYTTGAEDEWLDILNQYFRPTNTSAADDKLLADAKKRFIQETPGQFQKEEQDSSVTELLPFHLLRRARLNAITLCGVLRDISGSESSNHKPLAGVLEAVGIESLTGFSLRFRIYDRLSDKSFYEKLVSLDPQPTILQQASDRLVVFDLQNDPGVAIRLLELYDGAFGLFKQLDAQFDDDPTKTNSPTLQEVNLFLQRKHEEQSQNENESAHSNIPDVFLLDWLSDGERAFLGRMALLAMLDMQDSLIILDEPEVHFNDYWKREIIRFLNAFIKGCSNQILLTTHSTIVMSDVTANQVHLFVKGEDGKTQVNDTQSPLFGADPSYVMTNLLGTGRPGGTYSKEYLEAALKRNNRDELRNLLNLVGPGYWRLRIDEQLGGDDDLSNIHS